MPDRTVTAHLSSISLNLPTGPVTFHFPTSPLVTSLPKPNTASKLSTKQNHCVIAIPYRSPWSPGAHWHEAYTEHIRILKGRARVHINGVSRTYSSKDGVLTFEKFDIHNFCGVWNFDGDGAVEGGEEEGEEVWIEEWTDPDDGFKEVFFYNVMSIFSDQTKFGLFMTILQLFTTIQHVDNYVALLPAWMPFGVNYWLCHGFYALGKVVGKCVGLRTWYKEYTPREYWDVAEKGGDGGERN